MHRLALALAALFALGPGGAGVGKSSPAPASAAPVSTPGELPAILAAVRAPGARAVLVNVWATWCDPCREELPDLARFYRDHRQAGLRLIMVSADDEQDAAAVGRALASAGIPADTPSFIKRGDDMQFIDGLDRRWSGALPASFLFDGRGRPQKFWGGPVTSRMLSDGVAGLLGPATPPASPERRP